eukprot:CAMPEP_0114498410 /NCGR_PEP_ID=MMETSP0109-20121206/6861_1 /TAXON_ID=29199 /ORGANISM="Chlorarachnion reptans, Strain CCCM449" /LENGTH=224 /DNA_ID=CAMNT_0001675893 /DNA_START=432 /DNA_END=1106 /DNA_ORIENTATION=+
MKDPSEHYRVFSQYHANANANGCEDISWSSMQMGSYTFRASVPGHASSFPWIVGIAPGPMWYSRLSQIGNPNAGMRSEKWYHRSVRLMTTHIRRSGKDQTLKALAAITSRGLILMQMNIIQSEKLNNLVYCCMAAAKHRLRQLEPIASSRFEEEAAIDSVLNKNSLVYGYIQYRIAGSHLCLRMIANSSEEDDEILSSRIAKKGLTDIQKQVSGIFEKKNVSSL